MNPVSALWRWATSNLRANNISCRSLDDALPILGILIQTGRAVPFSKEQWMEDTRTREDIINELDAMMKQFPGG